MRGLFDFIYYLFLIGRNQYTELYWSL